VLTLDLLDGRLLRDAGEQATPEERARLAYAVATIWMEMVFRKGLFHGDPHPANILVLDDGRIGLVDFGLVERLSPEDMRHLVALFVDAVAGRTDNLPRRLADLGVRFPREQEEGLRTDLEGLWLRYAGVSLGEVDPMELLRELLGLIYRRRLRLPSRFLLLDRALITLGSVGQELNPDFNVFELARPYARGLAYSQLTPRALLRRLRDELGGSAQALLDLPREASALGERLLAGDVEIGVRLRGFERPMRRLDASINRVVLSVVVAALLVSSALIAMVPRGPHLLGLHVAAYPPFIAACGLGVVLAMLMVRRGGL
jgi:ubiquinone biosynthesis protein